MAIDLNSYLNNLITPPNIGEGNEPHTRWVFDKKRKRFGYIEKSNVPSSATKKIEKVLSLLNKDIRQFTVAEGNENTNEKLDHLIHRINLNVQRYKSRHSKIYLFFSRLFFGNIDIISSQLINRLNYLRHRNPGNDGLGGVGIPDGQPVQGIDPQDQMYHNLFNRNQNRYPNFNQNNRRLNFGFDQFFNNPIFNLPQRPAPNVPVGQNPQDEVDIAARSTPPVYGPYVPPAIDETRKLENEIKSSRLKFYKLFSEKIQPPQEGRPLRVPLIEITANAVFIRLPGERKVDPVTKKPVTKEVIKEMEDEDENGNITKIQVKSRVPDFAVSPNLVEFDDWFKQKLAASNAVCISTKDGVVRAPEGITCVKEYKLTLDDAKKLLQGVEECQGLANVADIVKENELKILNVHHYLQPEFWGFSPSIENTIAFTLAHLDPKLHKDIDNSRKHPAPQEAFAIPFVQFDEKGMTIKFPYQEIESETEVAGKKEKIKMPDENLKDLIKQFFGLSEKGIEEMLFDRPYKAMFRIKRDEIENFMNQLGLETIPADDLDDSYIKGDITYLQHLIRTNHYHPYRPVRKNDLLESISGSLANFVPNKNNAMPHVSYHPRGWLSIKLPAHSEEYNKKLASRLGCNLLTLPRSLGDTYRNEIIFYDDEKGVEDNEKKKKIEKLLKKLQLETAPNGTAYVDLLQQATSRDHLKVFYAETRPGKLDPLGTIARTISALDPVIRNGLEALAPTADPKSASLTLAQVRYRYNNLEIKIPKQLNDKTIAISPEKSLSFGEYVSFVFGFQGVLRREGNEDVYVINVPFEKIKSLLEKDLSLRSLDRYKQGNLSTFYDQVCNEMGIIIQHGSIVREGMRLRNPSVPLPDVIPEFTDDQIINIVTDVLDSHPKKSTYVHVFRSILNQIQPGQYRRSDRTAEYVSSYLRAIIDEIKKNEAIPVHRKREALENIAESCQSDVCLPGKYTKIQDVYQRLKCPEYGDKVKTALLYHVEQFKNDLLASQFGRNDFQGKRNSVHVVAAAKDRWGDEFGLDAEAGRKDEYLSCGSGYLSQFEKTQFENSCRRDLLDQVFTRIKNDKDEHGNIINFGDYRDRLRIILSESGLKPNQIDEELKLLVPTLDQYRTTLKSQLIRVGMTEEEKDKINKKVEDEVKLLWGDQKLLRENVIRKALKKVFKDQGLKPDEIEQKIVEVLPDQDKLLEELVISKLQPILSAQRISNNPNMIKSLMADRSRLNQILQRTGTSLQVFEDQIKNQIKDKINGILTAQGVQLKEDIEDEIKKCNDNAVTITKEAVTMLLGDIGVVYP